MSAGVHMRCIGLGLPLLLSIACPMSSPPHAPRTFHVAPGGDDGGPGSREEPWATLHHAAWTLKAGDHVLVHGGTYAIADEIRPRHSGTEDAWIVYAAAPGEEVIIDATAVPVPVPRRPPFAHDRGAFQIEGVAYLRVQGLTIRNSHRAGITIRDSHHVVVLDNTIQSTFTSGIAAWDSQHDGTGTDHIEIRGNTVTHTNTWDMLPPGWVRGREPPHEAISLGGVRHFEVSHNHVHHCDKEGIDIKENSGHGRVHHNHVHHVARQGLYVDGWFDTLQDVELFENVVHDNGSAGVAISVENGPAVQDLRVHHNLIYDNQGSGVYFSRWGDGPRRNVVLEHNTIHHNGHGQAKKDEAHFWMTGGIYLLSGNLEGIEIRDNVLSANRAFQIGVSHYLREGAADTEAALAAKQIVIERNLIDADADLEPPIAVAKGPPEHAQVWPTRGRDAIVGAADFVDAPAGDFRLRKGSVGTQSGTIPGARTVQEDD